jgi:hypothetical protein
MAEEQEEAEDSMDRGTKDGQKDGGGRVWHGEEGCCVLGNSRNEKSLGGGQGETLSGEFFSEKDMDGG